MRDMPLKKQWAVAVFALFAAVIFIGCATSSEHVPTSEQLTARGIDEAAFRRGRALAVTECASCHRFFRPGEYSHEEWPGIIRKMGGRASLSKSQTADIELYLVTMSHAARSE